LLYQDIFSSANYVKKLIMTLDSESSLREKVSMFNMQNFNQQTSILQNKKKKKKRPLTQTMSTGFHDLYKLTGETLGEGSYGSVKTCKNVYTGMEYAAKIIEKKPGSFSRSKVLKEIEIYHLCRGQRNIIQLIEFFDETDNFYLVFEKIEGGSLLKHIQERVNFTEAEASMIIKDLAEAIYHLHQRGIAHRDIKPDNVLCMNSNSPCKVKLCDFDLCSPVSIETTTPQLLSPVGSLEYMAPEVVDIFMVDDYYDDHDEDDISYDKKCDLWSLGIIMYILLCGYAPFSGTCGLNCGWEDGDSCVECQELLLSSIKIGEVSFAGKHWEIISREAKDLIRSLLEKDSFTRLSAHQVLDHPWIVNGGSNNTLSSPSNLKMQVSIKDLEDFVTRAMAVNRALEKDEDLEIEWNIVAMDIPEKRRTISFDFTPTILSTGKRRRRGSKELFSKFSSIDELESDFFMKNM